MFIFLHIETWARDRIFAMETGLDHTVPYPWTSPTILKSWLTQFVKHLNLCIFNSSPASFMMSIVDSLSSKTQNLHIVPWSFTYCCTQVSLYFLFDLTDSLVVLKPFVTTIYHTIVSDSPLLLSTLDVISNCTTYLFLAFLHSVLFYSELSHHSKNMWYSQPLFTQKLHHPPISSQILA